MEETGQSIYGALWTLFEILPHGALIVSSSGRILLANETARRLIGANDGLIVNGDILTAISPYHGRVLKHALRVSMQNENSEPAAGSIPRLNRPPIAAVAVPIARPPSGPSPPAIALFLFDSDGSSGPDENLLQKMFNLTRAECKVASLMMSGTSIEGVTSELGITASTTRNHLKRIFAKTRTKRQAELVSFLLRSPAGLLRSRKQTVPAAATVAHNAGADS